MGLLKGEFTVADDLPDDLKIGLFKQANTYQALIRTSHLRIEGKGDAGGASPNNGNLFAGHHSSVVSVFKMQISLKGR